MQEDIMQQPISNDDLMDVMEMTDHIANNIYDLFEKNEKNLVISALISACINIMIVQSDSRRGAIYNRNIFLQVFDDGISKATKEGILK